MLQHLRDILQGVVEETVLPEINERDPLADTGEGRGGEAVDPTGAPIPDEPSSASGFPGAESTDNPFVFEQPSNRDVAKYRQQRVDELLDALNVATENNDTQKIEEIRKQLLRITSSTNPMVDYVKKNDYFVNEPDTPGLNPLDMTQIYDTDLMYLPDTQRKEKELVEFTDVNPQLSVAGLSWGEVKVAAPESYTDGSDYSMTKPEFDNRSLMFQQEDHLPIHNDRNWPFYEAPLDFPTKPGVNQDLDEEQGQAFNTHAVLQTLPSVRDIKKHA